MASEAHEHHHDDSNDLVSAVHRARHGLIPTTAVAATFTVFHSYDFLYTIAAVTAWLLYSLFVLMAVAHRWDICSHCTQPPKRYATTEARAKEARVVHAAWHRQMSKVLVSVLLISIVLPKPYMDHWWGKLAAALLYLAAALDFAFIATRTVQHEALYRSECHLERCRAGREKHSPRFLWVGHYGPWFLLVLLPSAGALGMTSLHRGNGYQIGYGLSLLVIGYIVVAMTMKHSFTPCVHCAKNPPSNGEEQAERRMFWLTTFHRVGYMLPSVAFAVWVASWLDAGTLLGRGMLFVAAALLLPWAALSRVHGRVRPWCPWCRDNGGENAGAGAPDPTRNQPVPA